MPNTYLISAANQIRQAITSKKLEVDAKRRQIDERAKQAQQTVERLRAQIRVIEADMARPPEKQEDPNTDRTQKNRLVLDKQKEISVEERDMMLDRDRLLREIKDQEADLIDLESQARRLEIRD